MSEKILKEDELEKVSGGRYEKNEAKCINPNNYLNYIGKKVYAYFGQYSYVEGILEDSYPHKIIEMDMQLYVIQITLAQSKIKDVDSKTIKAGQTHRLNDTFWKVYSTE